MVVDEEEEWLRLRVIAMRWDPIGVSDLGGPDDEYDPLILHVAHLVNQGR